MKRKSAHKSTQLSKAIPCITIDEKTKYKKPLLRIILPSFSYVFMGHCYIYNKAVYALNLDIYVNKEVLPKRKRKK